jgi:hypothetical protein
LLFRQLPTVGQSIPFLFLFILNLSSAKRKYKKNYSKF